MTWLFSQGGYQLFSSQGQRGHVWGEKKVFIAGENGGKIRQLVPKTAAAVTAGQSRELGVGIRPAGI